MLLVSADFLASDFIASEELPSLLLAAKRRACTIIPVNIGPCVFSDTQKALQEFQAVNSPGDPLNRMKKSRAEEVLSKVSKRLLDGASQVDAKSSSARNAFVGYPEIDALIEGVKLAAWTVAQRVALRVLAKTDSAGENDIFDSLLDYQDCTDDDDRFWGATHTIECCLRLAPWLINHSQLSRMATHKNFSVRSVAASICMDMAHSAPDRVPVDILLKLSVYNEDWYVETPANSAIEAMAHSFPAVLNIFYERLQSAVSDERVHAAAALRDVAEKEPGLLDGKLMKSEFKRLTKHADEDAADQLKRVLQMLEGVKPKSPYQYGF